MLTGVGGSGQVTAETVRINNCIQMFLSKELLLPPLRSRAGTTTYARDFHECVFTCMTVFSPPYR